MKLAPQSVPYRALQKVSGFVVIAFFVANSNDWGLPAAAAAGGAILLAALAYEIAYYRRFAYELTADTLDITSGVISRREREIPYRRIQNVDVSQSVFQRALGIAAVDLETAGGSSTEGSIRFVKPDEATRLRREVQRRKSGSSAGETDGTAGDDEAADRGAVGPEEEELFAISPGELALVGALSFDGRLIGLLAFLSSGSVPVLSGFIPEASAAALTATAIVAVGGLFLVSWVLGAGVAFSNYYGFRLSRAGDELRYERGLFRRYSGSIPTEKVQTLTISDNPAKRALGYASLSIETAGYAPGQSGDGGSQAAVPIATTDRVYRLAHEVESFGAPTFSRPPKRIRWRYVFRYAIAVAVLVGIAFAIDWYVTPDLPWYGPAVLLLAVPPAAHLKWKHRGYWLGDDHLLTRNGFWSRTVTVVPYYRIQTVIDSRTIFQRRWDVATIVADTAGSSSLAGTSAAAVDFELDEAIELRETLQERLQSALTSHRDRRDRFEWFEGDVDELVESDPDADAAEATDAADTTEIEGAADTAEIPDAEGVSDARGTATSDATETATSDATETATSDADGTDTEATGIPDATDAEDVEESPDVPDDGVIRPDFSTSDRDYSEPAERIDTGEYAVDRFPSDADVAHRGDEPRGESDDEPTVDDGSTADDETDGGSAESDDTTPADGETADGEK
ncbi:PH domain-containing protein [Halorubrum sp. CBA1229]|uniref:PH domain-containing protein n=1 Tax=Halorubrum sp. CBA1229 TaxID=1853699 RepID=UPI000F3E8782|nr:PH domain-containing protein [Halorubrum sp. CBA1229]QKY18333.1 PH domain-containing protein [Halorubrum sp. CBA1229]